MSKKPGRLITLLLVTSVAKKKKKPDFFYPFSYGMSAGVVARDRRTENSNFIGIKLQRSPESGHRPYSRVRAQAIFVNFLKKITNLIHSKIFESTTQIVSCNHRKSRICFRCNGRDINRNIYENQFRTHSVPPKSHLELITTPSLTLNALFFIIFFH